MRFVVDVSPLSHPLLGIGNYIRGSLGGLVEASEGRHEVVAFAPTSIRGPERIEAALASVPLVGETDTAWAIAEEGGSESEATTRNRTEKRCIETGCGGEAVVVGLEYVKGPRCAAAGNSLTGRLVRCTRDP